MLSSIHMSEVLLGEISDFGILHNWILIQF